MITTMIATTKEQSKKLIELGLSVDTADMWWVKHYLIAKNQELDKPSDDEINDVFPAWSLSALLSMLPKSLIYTSNPLLNGYCCKNLEYDVETYGDDSIDAAFEMMCYLLENKLI